MSSVNDILGKWIYMEVIDSMPDVEMVHCDTRDFHIFLSNNTDHTILPKILKSIKGNVEDYMFARSEILGCLAALENASGGNKKWRLLLMKGINGWTKYIRFIRYKDGYIACDRSYKPLTRKQLDADNVLPDRFEDIVKNQKSIPGEFTQLVKDNFWNLVN